MAQHERGATGRDYGGGGMTTPQDGRQLPARAARATPELIESLLLRLMLSPRVMSEMAPLIRPEHFSGPAEQPYALLWRAMLLAYERYGVLDYAKVFDATRTVLASMPHFPPQQAAHVIAEPTTSNGRIGLIYWAYTEWAKYPLNDEQTRDIARLFLEDRYVTRPVETALAANTISLGDLTDAVARAQRVHQIGVNPIGEGLPDDWRPEPVHVESTGLPWCDAWLDGGHAPGEMNALLGPMGVGKTQFAVNLAIGAARVQRERARQTGLPMRRVYIATYELGADDIRRRLVCCAGRVHMASIREAVNLADALSSSTRGDYKQYEREDFAQRHDVPTHTPPPGEWERLAESRDLLRDCIRVLDLSGTSDKALRGEGGAAELAALIEADQQAGGNPGVACVVIDYAYIVCERWMYARGARMDQMRHWLGSLLDQLRLDIAGRFKTPLWVLHQFNKTGNASDPTRLPTHMDAAEAGLFAKAFTFCCCIGGKDETTSAVLFVASKRRRAGEYRPPTILKIVGEQARL
ncbi:MAG: hypothetical protein E6Q97_29765, partial [Desulfurellales bacterium]